MAVSGNAATLTVAEGTGPANTSPGSFTVALAANGAGIRDLAGQTGSFPATAPVDKAVPVLLSMAMKDINGNGKIDQVIATFSESLAPYGAGNTPWTLANVPSGGSLSAVAAVGATATLTVSEGAGNPDTSVGSFTVALATDPLRHRRQRRQPIGLRRDRARPTARARSDSRWSCEMPTATARSTR